MNEGTGDDPLFHEDIVDKVSAPHDLGVGLPVKLLPGYVLLDASAYEITHIERAVVLHISVFFC